MAKLRNKPVEIEAVQYWPGKTCQEVAEFTGIPHAEGDCYDVGRACAAVNDARGACNPWKESGEKQRDV